MTSFEKTLSFNSVCSGKGAEDGIDPTTHCDLNAVVAEECPFSGMTTGAPGVTSLERVTNPSRLMSPVLLGACDTSSDTQSVEEDVALDTTGETRRARCLAKNILASFELLPVRLDKAKRNALTCVFWRWQTNPLTLDPKESPFRRYNRTRSGHQIG